MVLHETGSIIIVYNLRKEGKDLEFDITEDSRDIRLRGDINQSSNGQTVKQRYSRDNSSSADIPLDYSLREYCSVLYLRPKMKIFIRGQRVKTKLIERSLSQTSIDEYRPNGVVSFILIPSFSIFLHFLRIML